MRKKEDTIYLQCTTETNSKVKPFMRNIPVATVTAADKLKDKLTRQNTAMIWHKDFAVVQGAEKKVVKVYRNRQPKNRDIKESKNTGQRL